MLLVPGVLLSATVARYSGSRIFWDSRSPVTIFSSGGYARLIELSDGRLMSCCESGGIKVSYSSNKGRSWGSATLIAPNANNTPNCVPDLIQLSDGTIIVGYNPRPAKPYSSDRRFGIRLRRSTDRGRTWSDEIHVYDADSTFENGCWEPSFLELPSGELQLYFADESPYTTTGEQQISLCRSFDGGLTWTAPQRVSFRKDYRDGMPVPVLLSDKKYIVVAIEDNGWDGIGDFIPTTVRVPLSSNWQSGTYISGTSSSRTRCVNYDYCPLARGGAPYLRVLPNGETILSHQSTYGDGDNMKMYTYVGNTQAKDFKAMSRPFYQGTTSGCWWNSLAVIDTGIVVAVAGMDGKIVMAKGYPMKQFLAPYATQTVDGRISTTDTYYTATANQVPMGSETGTFSYADFAYDSTGLYFICTVYRKGTRSQTPFPDGVTLYLESKGLSTSTPAASAYRISMLPDGTVTAEQGNGSTYIPVSPDGMEAASIVYSSYYRLELMVPWEQIGLSSPPFGQNIGVNLEVITGDGTQQVVEHIPDALPARPSTWMPLHLIQPTDPTGIKETEEGRWMREEGRVTREDRRCYDLSGREISRPTSQRPGMPHGIYITDGRKTAHK